MSKKKAANFTLDVSILETLKQLSDTTLIPQSRLVQKALEELFETLGEHLKEEA